MAVKISSLKVFYAFVFILFAFCSLSFSYDFAGGTGEPNDPYQIETAEQLLQIGSDANLLDKCFILNNDIDLDPNVTGLPPFTQAPIAPDAIVSSSFEGTPFSGIFDGNNFTISNLIIDASGNYYLGLFGYADPNAEIIDINLENSYIAGKHPTGGIVGHNEGLIENCHSSGTINGRFYAGGIAGKNYGWIISCSSNAETLSSEFDYIGGLVGLNEEITPGDFNTGIIIDCNSSGRISGRYDVGGLVGYNTSYIYDSFSTADVNAHLEYPLQGQNAGVLIGYNSGNVDSCYASGNVTANYNSGGLIGSNSGDVNSCYSTGNVTADHAAGGLIGYAEGDNIEITNCYSTCDVNCPGDNAGGLIGTAIGFSGGFTVPYNSVIRSCYSRCNVTSSGDNIGGLIGKTMFSVIDCNSDSNITGTNYVGGLIGTACYGDKGGLETIEKSIDSCYATGTVKATGNHTGGLIGAVLSGGQFIFIRTKIQNCHAQVNFELNNESDYIGGLIGYSSNWNDILTIENCSSIVDINAGQNCSCIGGLIGQSYDSYISDSYSNGCIKTLDNCTFIGGLLGEDYDYSSVSDCHSETAIKTGNNCEHIGGLCGKGSAENCYSIADIDTVNQCTYIGGLCGEGSGVFCYSIADIDIANQCTYIGGLCGEGSGVFCYSIADINTASQCSYIGGLAGSSYDFTFCYSTGNIHTTDFCSNIGGLTGHSTHYISESSSDVDIYTSNDCNFIGGLVGKNDFYVTKSFSKGNLNVSNNCHSIGGLVGQNNLRIYNCYSGKNITIYNNCEYIGGLIGVNNDEIEHCYSSSYISAPNDTLHIGGLCGENYNTISNCYFLDTAGPYNGYGTPLTDTQMKQQASFVIWDFIDIWAICEGTNYPRLQWQILPADFLCPDGVDFIDYAHFSDYWMNQNCADSNDCEGADFDLSGRVDSNDLKTFTESWLEEHLPAPPPY